MQPKATFYVLYVDYMGYSLVNVAPLEDNLFRILINTTDIASCITHSKAWMLHILMILIGRTT